MGIKQRGLSQDLEPPNLMGLSPKSYGFSMFFPQIPSGLSCSFLKCLGISTSWRWLAASPTGPMDTQLDHFRLPIFRRSRSLGWPRNLVQKVIFGIWNHPCLVNMLCRSEVGTVWSILPVTQHTVNNPFFLMELYLEYVQVQVQL